MSERKSTFFGFETKIKDSIRYRFKQTFDNGLILEAIVDSKWGFNVMRYEVRKSEQLPSDEVDLTYEVCDGTYVPKTYVLHKYDSRGGFRQLRTIVLTSSTLNGGVTDRQFALQALNPAKGDRLNDKIEGKNSIYLNERFVPPEESRKSQPTESLTLSFWWRVAAVVIGTCGALVAIVALRWARRGS